MLPLLSVWPAALQYCQNACAAFFFALSQSVSQAGHIAIKMAGFSDTRSTLSNVEHHQPAYRGTTNQVY